MAFLNPKPFQSNAFDRDSQSCNQGDVPDELDIFFRSESYFLPDGKEFKDLTPEEQKIVRDRYRFDCLRPGMYQTLTGFRGMI